MSFPHAIGAGPKVSDCALFVPLTEVTISSAVERVTEYLELPQEAPAIIESNRPPAYWPSSSSPSSQEEFISVEDLVIKYAPDLPAVLHGVSFQIKARERVGLVGRTGSGRLLAMTLFAYSNPG
jgi:ABC-type multidrug transport system fused ATPase/permease subunit